MPFVSLIASYHPRFWAQQVQAPLGCEPQDSGPPPATAAFSSVFSAATSTVAAGCSSVFTIAAGVADSSTVAAGSDSAFTTGIRIAGSSVAMAVSASAFTSCDGDDGGLDSSAVTGDFFSALAIAVEG